MPPKSKIGKEDILGAALDLLREEGEGALNARGVAARLGVSTQPLFTHYKDMKELRADLLAAATAVHRATVERVTAEGKYPPYKCEGIGYVRFATEEKNLFRLLFMRDRSAENVGDGKEELAPIIDMISAAIGIDREEAYHFHLANWLFVHGLAASLADGYLTLSEEVVSALLTEEYTALAAYYKKEGNGNDRICH